MIVHSLGDALGADLLLHLKGDQSSLQGSWVREQSSPRSTICPVLMVMTAHHTYPRTQARMRLLQLLSCLNAVGLGEWNLCSWQSQGSWTIFPAQVASSQAVWDPVIMAEATAFFFTFTVTPLSPVVCPPYLPIIPNSLAFGCACWIFPYLSFCHLFFSFTFNLTSLSPEFLLSGHGKGSRFLGKNVSDNELYR